jgi:hypothetical protein
MNPDIDKRDGPLLTRRQAVEHIVKQHRVPMTPQKLARLASKGGGPRYRKFGKKPLYDPPSLDDWVIQEFSKEVTSTAELKGAA